MQRMFNLSKWQRIAEGELVSFCGERPRTVRLEVNAPERVKLYVTEGKAEPVFLAAVEGRDTVEFSSDGAFDLYVVGGEISVFTAEGQDWTVQSVSNATFTKIVERRIRNPELEYMMAVTYANMEKRLAAQSAELDRRLQARIAGTDLGPAPTAPTENVGAPAASAAGSGATSDPATAPAGAGTSDELAPATVPAN